MDGVVELPRLDAGPWFIDGVLDARAVHAFRSWLLDPVLAASVGRSPTSYTMEEVGILFTRHDRRTGWMGFVRDAADGRPVGYVSLNVVPSNGVARVDMLMGDPTLVAPQVQDAVFRAMGNWAFRVQRMRKAAFDVRADNHASVRWLSRRATLKGRLRGEIMLADGRAVDCLRFGVMADEWDEIERRMPETPTVPAFRRRHRGPDRVASAFR